MRMVLSIVLKIMRKLIFILFIITITIYLCFRCFNDLFITRMKGSLFGNVVVMVFFILKLNLISFILVDLGLY